MSSGGGGFGGIFRKIDPVGRWITDKTGGKLDPLSLYDKPKVITPPTPGIEVRDGGPTKKRIPSKNRSTLAGASTGLLDAKTTGQLGS